ncbi:MAG: glucose-1-phosphate adenylyltransferase [Phototrophicales bacterium]|nr:MAG: glucose-1-phosphate adenylyltransferase [Phototrophicales bacterium]
MPTTRAVILAGGEGTRLGVLTAKRAKPAVPFAGKYRIIDFVLSNCVNSNIFDVLVLTQYRPHSLNEHIGRGRPWDLDRSFSGGIQLLQPYRGRRDTDWYKGTADAVAQNFNFVRRGAPQNVLILSGDHIYQMDYDTMIRFHNEQDADVTIAVIDVPLEEASRFGIMFTDANMNVLQFFEKPKDPPGTLANMGIYVFKTSVLDHYLAEDAARQDSDHDFGKNIIPNMIADGLRVVAFPFSGYWVDVGTLYAYWESHMDLLQNPPPLDLNDRSWVIHTRSEERPPVKIERGAQIVDSLITDGSIIAEGATVERSVLSPGVYVGPGAVVRESVLLTDTYIEAGAVVEQCIIDKIVVVGQNAKVGRMTSGKKPNLTTIGKSAHIPANAIVGAGVVIASEVDEEQFLSMYPDGEVPDNVRVAYTGP